MFNKKLEAIIICMLNSFPSHFNPSEAISKASLPNPEPGTNMDTGLLLLIKIRLIKFF